MQINDLKLVRHFAFYLMSAPEQGGAPALPHIKYVEYSFLIMTF